MKQAWKKLFKPWILERGYEYFDEQRVTDLEINSDQVTAYVMGSDDYYVSILLDNNEPTEFYCNCPYAEGGEYCKHMAAVLFACNDSVDINHNPILSDNSKWQTAIDQLPAETLRMLIRKWAEKNPQFQTELALLYTGTLPSGLACTWEDTLQEMIDDASNRHGYVDYRDAYDLMCDMSDYMDQQLDLLLDAGLLMDAFELVYTVFTIADDVEMDDSDGGLYMLFSECTDAWRKIVDLADHTQQAELYQKFIECIDNSKWSFGIQEFEDLFFSLSWNDNFLHETHRLLDRTIARYKDGDDYRLSQYLSFKENTMRRLGASDCEIISFWKTYFHLPTARTRLLDIYMTCDLDAAIALLCECKKLDHNTSLSVVHHSEKLVELYHLKNMHEALKDELQFLIFKCRAIKNTHLQMLKNLSSPEDWTMSVQQLLALPLWPRERFVIFNFEHRYQQLLDELVEQVDFIAFEHYEKSLYSWSPEKTCDCYVDFLKHEMRAASNRKQYWSVIQHLKNLLKYPNGNQTVSAVVQYWRTQHNNRPAMKDELQKAGY